MLLNAPPHLSVRTGLQPVKEVVIHHFAAMGLLGVTFSMLILLQVLSQGAYYLFSSLA